MLLANYRSRQVRSKTLALVWVCPQIPQASKTKPSIMNGAYIMAGKPKELREVFVDVQSAFPNPCRQRLA